MVNGTTPAFIHSPEASSYRSQRWRMVVRMPPGTNITAPTIRTTNDKPIVYPPTFDALGLVAYQINPHYLDPDPNSTHKGETREDRIREFLEENETPVVGIREGSMIRVEDGVSTLVGMRPARIFERGKEPHEVEVGSALFTG